MTETYEDILNKLDLYLNDSDSESDLDIDNQNNDLFANTLTINMNPNNQQAQAQIPVQVQAQPINYQLLKLYIDTIPTYDGNPHTLNLFINSCENLFRQFVNPHDVQFNSFLLRAILGKLTGRALSLVGSRIELVEWHQIRDLLQLSFGDQRNIDCLIQDLITLQINKNETPYNFGMRCQDARSLIVAKLNSLPGVPPEEKIIKMNTYNDLALKTFIRGLTGQLQNNIRLRNPNSLEQAMSFVIEEENFLYSTFKTNSLNSHNYAPNRRMTPSSNSKPFNNFQKSNFSNNNQFRTNYFQQQRPSFNTNFNFNRQNTQFPNTSHQNASPQQQYNFNRPNNTNFKPTNFPFQKDPYFLQRPSEIRRREEPFWKQNKYRNQQYQNQYPQPMDTSSGNSYLNKPQQNLNVQELHFQNVADSQNSDQEHNLENDYLVNQSNFQIVESKNEKT